MIVRSISIKRQGHYGFDGERTDASKPFEATICVVGQTGKVELTLPPELSRRVVEIIAEEVAAAGRATAEAMTAEAMNIVTLPSPEAA
jgi:hypothetical protein